MKSPRSLCCVVILALAAFVLPAFAQSVADVPDVVTKFDTPPRPLKTKPPQYPSTMRAQGVSGVVVVAMVIDEGGKVMACEVSKTSNDAFSTPAIEAVRSWTFEPAKVAGKAVRAKVSVPLKFEVEA
ncbi:MAG TPA: TonB family protein [Acidobacteriota bacterium]|nr:TonB family protein [Acidobacteriota bacterium]